MGSIKKINQNQHIITSNIYLNILNTQNILPLHSYISNKNIFIKYSYILHLLIPYPNKISYFTYLNKNHTYNLSCHHGPVVDHTLNTWVQIPSALIREGERKRRGPDNPSFFKKMPTNHFVHSQEKKRKSPVRLSKN